MAIKKKPIVAPDHIYVPKHEIIPIEEAEKVLEKFQFSEFSYNLFHRKKIFFDRYLKLKLNEFRLIGSVFLLFCALE